MVFATSSRSSTESHVGHLLVVFATSSRSSTERNLQPWVWLNTTWTIVTCRGLRPWVMWDIYEWYLLLHRGAVLRGMRDFSESVVFSLFLLGVLLDAGFLVVVVLGFAVGFLFGDT